METPKKFKICQKCEKRRATTILCGDHIWLCDKCNEKRVNSKYGGYF